MQGLIHTNLLLNYRYPLIEVNNLRAKLGLEITTYPNLRVKPRVFCLLFNLGSLDLSIDNIYPGAKFSLNFLRGLAMRDFDGLALGFEASDILFCGQEFLP